MVGWIVPLTTSEQNLAAAAAAFLAQPTLARSTRRSYEQTLSRLVYELGGDQPLSALSVEAVTAAVTAAWSGRAPATWNRQVATVRSFIGFCRRRRWLTDDLTADLERRPEPVDRTRAIPPFRAGPTLASRQHPRARQGSVAVSVRDSGALPRPSV